MMFLLGLLMVLQVPFCADSNVCGSRTWSDTPPLFDSSLQTVIGGMAKTTQFPTTSLNGLGNFVATPYGPRQIAIPIPSVNVGTR